MFHLDTSELAKFLNTMNAKSRKKYNQTGKIVSHAALNIKKAVKDDLEKSHYKYFRRIPVSYVLKKEHLKFTAEIAPLKGSPGSIANIAFFGSSTGGGTHKFYEYAPPEFARTIEEIKKVGLDI